MHGIRFVLAVLFALSTAWGVGQGSAAGYGQAAPGGSGGLGGGGGFGIGGGATGDREARKAPRPEDDAPGWETRTAILTPGDRVEYKFVMKKGEVMMAAVSSDAFDPALSLEDSTGKVLAKNDDRVDGDQSPFLIHRVPQDGTYLLKVLSYRSVAGGRFTLKFHTFVPLDTSIGVKRYETPQVGDPVATVVFRVAAKKGIVYDLRRPMARSPTFSRVLQFKRVIGPTGVAESDFTVLPMKDLSNVFVALADGDYYVEYVNYSDLIAYESDLHEIEPKSVKTEAKMDLPLGSGGLAVIDFEVEPRTVVRTRLNGAFFYTMAAAAADGTRWNQEETTGNIGNNRMYGWFRINVYSDRDVVRVFHQKGTVRLAMRSLLPREQSVRLENIVDLPVWQPDKPFTEKLAIGESKLFLVRSSKSELMRVDVSADHFLPKLEIFRMNGEIANTLLDWATKRASDDLYFPEADSFIVRVSCYGDGGSGEVSMSRQTLKPEAYSLGTIKSVKLDGSNFGLYSVDLEAGKRYELMTSAPQSGIRADLLDENGQFLQSQQIRFDNVELQFFTPVRSGRHRLWLRGQPGERQFRFQVHTAPGFGSASSGSSRSE